MIISNATAIALFLICLIVIVMLYLPNVQSQTILSKQQEFSELCGVWTTFVPPCEDSSRLKVDEWYKDDDKNLTDSCLSTFPSAVEADAYLKCSDSCKNECATNLEADFTVSKDMPYDPTIAANNKLTFTLRNSGSLSVMGVEWSVTDLAGTVLLTGTQDMYTVSDYELIKNVDVLSMESKSIEIHVDPALKLKESNENNNCMRLVCRGPEVMKMLCTTEEC